MSERRRRRWYRFTPDRFIVGLLAVEGFLLLAERLRWFAFNEKKGFTVLVAAAAVCLGVLLLLLWFAVSLLLRRRFQFGVRSLLVLALAAAIACSWLGVTRQQATRQREAVEAIEKAGGEVRYDYEEDVHALPISPRAQPGPAWVRQVLGDDFFSEVEYVRLSENGGDDTMEHVEALRNLRDLNLRGTQVTDAGLGHLRGLTNLWSLVLDDTQVTDAGLEHLRGLTNLQHLYLGGTRVTDAGLEHLKGLTSLWSLVLCDTQVTEEGVKKFQEALLPRCIDLLLY